MTVCWQNLLHRPVHKLMQYQVPDDRDSSVAGAQCLGWQWVTVPDLSKVLLLLNCEL